MFTINSNFICRFKVGDNIIYNLKILKLLYDNYEKDAQSTEKLLLHKPIILIIASITEAVLHDFHLRIRANKFEGIAGLLYESISYIRSKPANNIDEFSKYIDSAQKHDFFEQKDTNFYNQLHELRKLRNKIHIQNSNADEVNLFTADAKVNAEVILEIILKKMSKKYHRPLKEKYIPDFEIPWKEHFPPSSNTYAFGYTEEELRLMGVI